MDDESEPFKGFNVDVRFKMLDNFENNWEKDRPTMFNRVIPEDYAVPEPGPTIERANNFSYLNYFQLFVSNQIIEKIAVYTASNARHKGQANFNPPSVDEIKAFFGLYIATNDFIVTPSDHRLFIQDETKWLFHTPRFRTVFTRKHFEEIKCFIHFSDPYDVIPDRSSPDYDPLYKTGPFINHLQEKFKSLWTPKPQISIDEAMVSFKGRLRTKQFISNKPVRFGIKLWKLCESATGYCYKFDVYMRKSKDADDPLPLRRSAAISMNLVKGLEHKNYDVYMDNYHTSVPLFLALADKGIGGCVWWPSTIRHVFVV